MNGNDLYSGACSGPIIIFNTNCPMTVHNQIFENVWPPSLDSKNRLQNFQDMVESTIQRCFEITHFRRKIQQILEFQKVENQTVQLEIMDFTLQKHHEFDLSSDSEHLIKRPLKEINDPERLKRVVRYIDDTEE